MKILITGSTGYIAQRLLPLLLESGHEVICCLRDKNRFDSEKYKDFRITLLEVDFLDPESLKAIPNNIDVAYYLMHSMSATEGDFSEMEQDTANNFRIRIEQTAVKQVIYLSGIINDTQLSKHLDSRKNVESILGTASFALTTLRAGIIVGSGSASFEIIRDLVEKLPVMIAPRWLKTKCQPIAIRNVLEYLYGVLMLNSSFNQSYDIAGPEILTYKEMLQQFAAARKLKRRILVVPIMTPRLSSYWLYFVTSTSYTLARHLVESMKVEIIAQPNNLHQQLNISLIPYQQSIKLAFGKIEQNQVISSWRDAMNSNAYRTGFSSLVEVPIAGCFTDKQTIQVNNPEKVMKNIWSIGGTTGWYYADFLWSIRGILDKMVGGVGLKRGRTNVNEILPGHVIDFWRVILADKKARRLLLYAEMKLPGEAWLEFKLGDDNVLLQTATFRPLGILGRLYWYSVLPFHSFIFKGMLKRIAET
ncbi:MAG: SDR family oxidoreductase [Pyrinomonadaceae bacterium]|nr:SDR family oxidoreductase [Sphingobacteriaceae bacterium]